MVDAAHVLPETDKAALVAKLTHLQDDTGVQFAVATVHSLGGDEIEPYANALFRKWKLGQKGADNGLLLVLAPSERKLRFEVGYGLEGTFTDVQSKLILHNTMVPKLKAGDPAGALKAGVDDAILVLTKDKASLPERLKPDDQLSTGFLIMLALVILIIIIAIVVITRRSARSGWTTGAVVGSSIGSDLADDTSSPGGDSFSGGGGGDSGGGGASDSY